VAKRDLPQGHILTDDDIAMKSPGGGVPPYEWENLVGMVLTHPMKEDDAFDLVQVGGRKSA